MTDNVNVSSLDSSCVNMVNYQLARHATSFAQISYIALSFFNKDVLFLNLYYADLELDVSQRIESLQDKLREYKQSFYVLKWSHDKNWRR